MALFRLLAGKHTQGGHWITNKDGARRRILGKTYVRGDIIDTDQDLSQLNSTGSIKFERVNSSGQVVRESTSTRLPQQHNQQNPPVQDEADEKATLLEGMTVADLRALAAEEEIDLGSASRKDEIIKVLRAAYASQAAEAGFRS